MTGKLLHMTMTSSNKLVLKDGRKTVMNVLACKYQQILIAPCNVKVIRNFMILSC